MIDNIEQLHNAELFVHCIEEEIILTEMEFPYALPMPDECMIPPSCTENKERSIIVCSEEVAHLHQCRKKTWPPTPPELFDCPEEMPGWNDPVRHRPRISSRNSPPPL